MTKREKHLYENYKASNARDLFDIYKKPSILKTMAYEKILEECLDCEGYEVRVIRGNHQTFSMAYLRNTPTGKTELVYHTYCTTHIIKI